ncbi:MAG: ParB/RepB/Spo0J family partition protein [Methyloprofundus sp.]|nr:ParB/RepB/Spo0J family partition protein [Methyloprofundus sp.]
MKTESRLSGKLKATSQLLNRAKQTGKRVLELPLEDVRTDPGQVRKSFDEAALNGLAVSLKNQGQIEPIVVSPSGNDGKYLIQKGERRYRAAKIAGLETIQAIVNDEPNLSDITLSMQQLVENIQREDLLPHEIACALGKMRDSGLSNKDIADSIGKSQAWVSQHITILNAVGIVKTLIDAGKAADATTINELIKLYDERREVCEKYCQGLLDGEGMIAVRSEVRKLRQGREVATPQSKNASATYKTVKVQVPTEVMATLENLVEKINNNPNSSYGKIDVGGLLRILTESLSVRSAENTEANVTGIDLKLI